MNATPDILLCVTVLRTEEKLILEALRAEGLDVSVVLKEDLGKCLNGKGRPRAALIRNLSHRDALAWARLLEHAGIKTFNHSSAIEFCTSKAYQALAFRRQGVPQPAFQLAFSVDDVSALGGSFGFPYIVKPVDASWGRGVVRIASKDSFESWAGGRESCDVGEKSFPVLVQEQVNKGDFDIRVVVVGSTPVVAFKRVSTHWKTNTHLGAKVEPIAISAAIRALCRRTIAVMGEGVYGIDLFEDQATGDLLVCEVNHNPEFSRSMPIHGVDIPRLIAAYVKSGTVATSVKPAPARASSYLNEASP